MSQQRSRPSGTRSHHRHRRSNRGPRKQLARFWKKRRRLVIQVLAVIIILAAMFLMFTEIDKLQQQAAMPKEPYQ